ncbi:hypothetical protein ACQR18_30480, partial [Bradyrhizobium oligotrophicum]
SLEAGRSPVYKKDSCSPGTGLIAPVTCATRQVGIRLGASIGAPGPHGLNVRELPIVQRNST